MWQLVFASSTVSILFSEGPKGCVQLVRISETPPSCTIIMLSRLLGLPTGAGCQRNCSSHINYRPYLAICSVLLSPGSHHKCVIDSNASDLLHTFALQIRSLLHKTWEVSLKATRYLYSVSWCTDDREQDTAKTRDWKCGLNLGTTRGKSSRYSEEDSLLPLEELVHGHLISWLPLLDFHCRETFTNLLRIEETIIQESRPTFSDYNCEWYQY